MDGILLEGQEGSGRNSCQLSSVISLLYQQLFARRGNLPESSWSSWTVFDMVLRDPTPIPSAFDFIRFLASSITFMTHLSEVSVFLDDKRLAKLTKVAGVPMPIEIPRGLQSSSRRGIMNVVDVKTTRPCLVDCFIAF